MASEGWGRAFDPTALPDGRQLVSLRDAGEYIAALPQSEQQQANWHTTAEMLMQAAEGRGLLMFAYVARSGASPQSGQEVSGRSMKDDKVNEAVHRPYSLQLCSRSIKRR
jgi:hypothetical protein